MELKEQKGTEEISLSGAEGAKNPEKKCLSGVEGAKKARRKTAGLVDPSRPSILFLIKLLGICDNLSKALSNEKSPNSQDR